MDQLKWPSVGYVPEYTPLSPPVVGKLKYQIAWMDQLPQQSVLDLKQK